MGERAADTDDGADDRVRRADHLALVALGLIEFGETVSGLVTTPEAAVRDGERDGERKEQGTWSSTR